ncbi:MAG: AbrB/MazE/SpoVT family DNA-binding domain-containing protein [Gammaproteobacteria bacterium]|nr:AbrB/MazE/SpoVT family DNA-binding domain-containing protein [Gammaproteobacteria bacterium]
MAYSKMTPGEPVAPGLVPDAALGGDPGSRRVRMDSGGRIVVPAGFRRALGVGTGQELLMSLDDGFVRLQTIDAALEQVRAIARRRRRNDASVVDEFIAERRREAATE